MLSSKWRMDRLPGTHIILAAALFSLHHWVAIAINHGDYTPFSASSSVSAVTFDETTIYAPQARRFMAVGRLYPESDNYELRSLHGAMPFLPEAVLGAMGGALGSLEWAFIVADVLFPAALLFLFFCLSENIVQSRALRLLIAWSTLLIPFAPRSFFWLGYNGPLAPLEITRTPHPDLSILFLLIGVFVLARALGARAGRPALLLAGLASGINVYTYYFYTVGWTIALLLLFGAALVWRQWRMAARVAIVGAVTMLLAIPFVAFAVKGKIEGGQGNFLAQVGNYTHQPHLPALILGLAGFGIFLIRARPLFDTSQARLRIGLLSLSVLGGLFGMNGQIISGFDVAGFHFMYRLVQPIGYFLAACGLGWLVEHGHSRLKPNLNRFAAIAIAILLVNAAARQSYAAIRFAPYQRSGNPRIKLLTWVRSHLPPEQVIGTLDPELALLIPAIAPDFTYVPGGLRSFTPTREIGDRYLDLASLLGYSQEDVAGEAKPELLEDLRLGIADPADLAPAYGTFLAKNSPRTRRLDYVVVKAGRIEPLPLIRRFPEARVIYEDETYRLMACGPSGRGRR